LRVFDWSPVWRGRRGGHQRNDARDGHHHQDNARPEDHRGLSGLEHALLPHRGIQHRQRQRVRHCPDGALSADA
jgi:hypothetical protein